MTCSKAAMGNVGAGSGFAMHIESGSPTFLLCLAAWRHEIHACCRTTVPRCLQLTAGAEATWQEIGSMPHKRVMGDGVILCDGTIGILNGAADGIGVSLFPRCDRDVAFIHANRGDLPLRGHQQPSLACRPPCLPTNPACLPAFRSAPAHSCHPLPARLPARLQGWVDKPQEVKFKDGSTWQCEEKCSKAAKPVYEPTLFDPGTGVCRP